MRFNEWYEALMRQRNSSRGDQDFIEFTVDASGFELPAGTPMISSNADAPWMIPSGYYPDEYAPKYKSAWEQIYHPSLVEEARS